MGSGRGALIVATADSSLPDVVDSCDWHLDLDARDASLRFLKCAVALHAAGNGPVGHDPIWPRIIP